MDNELGKEIREKRKKLGYTQDELAELSGVSKSTIGRIERGDLSPKVEYVNEIYYALGVKEFKSSFLNLEKTMKQSIFTAINSKLLRYGYEIINEFEDIFDNEGGDDYQNMLKDKNRTVIIEDFAGSDDINIPADVFKDFFTHLVNRFESSIDDFMIIIDLCNEYAHRKD